VDRGSRRLATVIALAVLVALAAPTDGLAAKGAKRHLVETYAPITMLRAQEHPPCDVDEEQYEPTTVDAVLGNPDVTLERPAEGDRRRVSKPAPTSADIAGLGDRYYLDLPGDPLDAGCTYARDFAAIKSQGKAPAITYAHIAREAGEPGIALQYWFYYYFNQFNDLHESDWEGMQITFDAASAREALANGPDQIVLFQHSGGERGEWDDAKVKKEGTHPIVHPAAGSHATFYDSAVYVENGRHGSGLGCDNTSEPLRRVDPRPLLVPTDPREGTRFEWLTYEGRWGQKEKSFNNGPTGPNTKTQWTEPFTWMDGTRSTSPQLPGGFALGPTITGAFCATVKVLSGFINLEAQTTLGAVLIILVAVLLIAVPAVLTRWSPVSLEPLRQRRAFGQLIRAARQLYGHAKHWHTLVLIGLSAIPLIGVVEGLEWVVLKLTGGGSFGNGVSNLVGAVGQPLGFALVGAVVITFVRDLERGDPPGFLDAYRRLLGRFWRVVVGELLAVLVPLALAATVILLPVAIWKYVSWQFVQQEILFNDRRIREAFRASSAAVRGHWWEVVRVAGFLWLVSVVTGPVLGFALIFTPLPLIWINILGTVVYALLIPYVAIGRTLLYFDVLVRREEVAAEPTRRRRWWSRLRTRTA
jgi:hypothetical protein